MKHYQLFIVILFFVTFTSCAQEESRYITCFKGTNAYELAKAVEREDLKRIEILVGQNNDLLNTVNSISGSNVLVTSVQIEKLSSFKKLLELGASPNFINPYTRHSILIDVIKPFGSQFEWRKEHQYVELLLEYGADPNYMIENDFTNENQKYIRATSPLMEASNYDLDIVKLLISKGANPYAKLGEKGLTPFGEAMKASKFNLINYYIDTLKVDVTQPLRIRTNDSLFIQDYVKKFMSYQKGSEGYDKRQKLIEKLKSKDIDFDNYSYKL